MSGYWKGVPKGTWTIVDPVDCINAIADNESYVEYDYNHKRYNVLGPQGKAVIIDFDKVRENASKEEMDKINNLLKELDLLF